MPKRKGCKELTPQMRARLCELHSIGWGARRIHRKHPEIPISTISYTLKMERVRDDNRSLQRPGQKRKLTEEHRDHIYDRIHSDPHVMYETLISEIDEAVLKRSIQNLTREWGKRKWIPKRRPEIKPAHAAKCLAWAREYEFFTPEDWARVKWSDECMY